jgi:hypothetical protein
MSKAQRFWQCPHCGGFGRLPISRDLADVLDALNAGGTLGDVRKLINKPRTVVQNRIFRLMHMDLIERTKRRGQWFYRPTNGTQPEGRNAKNGAARKAR